ncbi:MAG: alpha-N-acetylglucosaminidase TIM-barrel domain-containing protein [Bacteroidales bacterium]|nr:alpha-N-acetylglucosaminidase TIM-barrel domain-containing protein [Bacteroidales bacterium]
MIAAKKYIRFILLQIIPLSIMTCHAGTLAGKNYLSHDSTIAEAYHLAERVLGDRAGSFLFKYFENDTVHNAFEVSSSGDTIVIKGNSGINLASGLNWYLNHYCNAQFTVIDEHIDLPSRLPLPGKATLIRTPFKYRYFFNICTFGYTMAWWGWEEWERQIDWMAMNGVNMPLAITGQEAVWYDVYRELGLTDAQINDFITVPAYFPWGWMGNIDGLGGPLPASWRESHIELQRKIVNRERALGMTPVLQGFTGNIPESLVKIFPDANDTLFLASMNRSVYRAMSSADPEAIWVLQGWFLYYQKEFWKEPQSKTFISAVPDDKMILLATGLKTQGGGEKHRKKKRFMNGMQKTR